MSTVGPLKIVGDYTDQDVQIVADLLDLSWPWWVLLRLDGPEVAFYDRTRISLGGVIRGNTAEIWGRFYDDLQPRSTRWAVHHEVAHLLDRSVYSASLTQNRRHLRDELHALMHPTGDHDHMTTERPLPDGMHGWGLRGVEHHESPSEAFAEWFASATGARQRTSYGPHSWASTSDQIEETFLQHAKGATVFEDTEDETVLRAASLGLVQGYDDGMFHPDQPVTRRQLAYVACNLYDTIRGDGE